MGLMPMKGSWQNWEAMALCPRLSQVAPASCFPVWAQKKGIFSIFHGKPVVDSEIYLTGVEFTITWIMDLYEHG